MYNLRQKGKDGLEASKASWKIQSNRQKKKTPESPMGDFTFWQAGQGLH